MEDADGLWTAVNASVHHAGDGGGGLSIYKEGFYSKVITSYSPRL